MAVQQNKVTRSRRNKRRSHHALAGPTLSVDQTTGEVHRRHQLTPSGFYRGRQQVDTPLGKQKPDEEPSK